MQWQPTTPPSPRRKRLAFAIAMIPVALLVIGMLVLTWQWLGTATIQ